MRGVTIGAQAARFQHGLRAKASRVRFFAIVAVILSAILALRPNVDGNLAAFSKTPLHRPRALVTGAAGYIGRELCCQLLENGWHVTAGVRDVEAQRAQTLAALASEITGEDQRFRLVPLNLSNDSAVLSAFEDSAPAVVFHVASVFRPAENPYLEIVQANVAAAETVVRACGRLKDVPLLVLTSSMAAVRGAGQPLREGHVCYDHCDWNSVSSPSQGWGGAYQYSKMESERRAWALAAQEGVKMVSICPSMVLGPERRPLAAHDEEVGFSVGMAQAWLRGDQRVKSLLIVDVRDVARAHISAARAGETVIGERFIVSTEVRLLPEDLAEAFRSALENAPHRSHTGNFAAQLVADDAPVGGIIASGAKEVDCAMRLKRELGLRCRDVCSTARDMASYLACVGTA